MFQAKFYLSTRASLQGGLHHDVALHAHLELRDLGRYRTFPGGPQRPQELSSSNSVYDYSPVLTYRQCKDYLVERSSTFFYSIILT